MLAFASDNALTKRLSFHRGAVIGGCAASGSPSPFQTFGLYLPRRALTLIGTTILGWPCWHGTSIARGLAGRRGVGRLWRLGLRLRYLRDVRGIRRAQGGGGGAV